MTTTTRYASALVTLSLAVIPLRLEAQEGTVHASGETAGVVVEHAEIILSPAPDGMASGYLVLFNGTAEEMTLASVESPAFGDVSLHRTETSSGVVRMRPVDGPLRIPQNTELVMRPGGLHLMLTEPASGDVPQGGTVALELRFIDGASQTVEAELKGVGERPVDHHHGEGSDHSHADAETAP